MIRFCSTVSIIVLSMGCNAPPAPAETLPGAPTASAPRPVPPPVAAPAEPARYLGVERLLASFEEPKNQEKRRRRGKRRRR